jgi:hypothetical protein
MAKAPTPRILSSGVKLYFSDFFEASRLQLEWCGAFNISLVSDLPLFISALPDCRLRNALFTLLHTLSVPKHVQSFSYGEQFIGFA